MVRRSMRQTNPNPKPLPKVTLYVLKCKDSRWYVGITGDMRRRWKEHCSGRGAEWTKVHPPLSISSQSTVFLKDAMNEEAKLTSKMMLKYGINNVRGAQLTFARSYDWRASDVRHVTRLIAKPLGLSVPPPLNAPDPDTGPDGNSVPEAEGSDAHKGLCPKCGRTSPRRNERYPRRHARGWKFWKSRCESCETLAPPSVTPASNNGENSIAHPSTMARRSMTNIDAAPKPVPTRTLYVLKCKNARWFVGITGDMERRWNEHCTGRCTEWTKMHPPQAISSQRNVPLYDAVDEAAKLTSKLMLKYGINNVRGGQLTYSRPYDWRKRDVRIVTSCLSKSLGLGVSAAKYCRSKVISKKIASKKVAPKQAKQSNGGDSSSRRVTCSRCGRGAHSRKDCYARRHLKGWKIWKSGCEKCGRNSHSISKCYARTDLNGNPI